MNHLAWYVARSTGITAWALLTASVLWGLSLSSKIGAGKRRDSRLRMPRPNWQLDLHRYLGGLATIFTLVHIVAIIADGYTHFTLLSTLVPFVSTWRPGAIAWGIVGLYVLLAVELTSLARKKLSKRVWRAVHFASLPLFVVATIHGVQSGTDVHSWIAQIVAAASIGAVAGLTAWRVQSAVDNPKPKRPQLAAR